MVSKRDTRIDIFKGIGIFLMLIGHVGLWGPASYYLHSFHMPMFFAASGYLYREKRSLPEEFSAKARGLLVPYGIMSVFLFLIQTIRYGVKGLPTPPYEQLYHSFTDNTTSVPLGGIWFLTALFIAESVYIVINRLVRNRVLMDLFSVACLCVGVTLPTVLPFRLWWSMDSALVGVFFFHAGKRFKEIRTAEGTMLSEKRIKSYILVLLLILQAILTFTNQEVNMRTGTYGNVLLFVVNALAGTYAMFLIADLLYCVSRKESVISSVVRVFRGLLERLGKSSLLYLCFNMMIIELGLDLLRWAAGWDTWGKAAHFGGKIVLLAVAILLIMQLDRIHFADYLTGRRKLRKSE